MSVQDQTYITRAMRLAVCIVLLGILGLSRASSIPCTLPVLDPFDITTLYRSCWYNYCFSGPADCVKTEFIEDYDCKTRFNFTESASFAGSTAVTVTCGYGEPANYDSQEAKLIFFIETVDEYGSINYVKANIWILDEVNDGYGNHCLILHSPDNGSVEVMCPQPLYEDCEELEKNLASAFYRIYKQGGPGREQCLNKDNSCCLF